MAPPAVYPRPLHVRLVATHHLVVLVSLVGRVYMWNARGVNNGVNINHQTGLRAGSHRVVSPVVYPPPTHVRLVATQLPGVPVPLPPRSGIQSGGMFWRNLRGEFLRQ